MTSARCVAFCENKCVANLQNAGKFQSCLDCAKASDIYEFFKDTCTQLGHEVGTASSDGKSSDSKSDGKSGARSLSVSVAAVAAGAVAAALF